MANYKNLKPIKKGDLSKEELKKRQSNGGKKSVQKRREKKELKELFNTFLSMNAPQKMKDKASKILPELENKNLSLKASLVICLIEKIIKGDTKAFEIMRDTIGEKPVDKQLLAQTTPEQLNITVDEKAITKAIERTRTLSDE